jgi:uncharacterized protein HemX
MDTNPLSNSETQAPFPASPEPRSGNIGALAAAVVIVLILAAGGFYFFHTQEVRQAATDAQLQQAGEQDSAPAPQSDSVDSIQTDLDATATGSADQDVDNLDSAL